jgi:uncharacterized protein YbjT (DUF2867 family)
MQAERTALVAGASGLVGMALIRQLTESPEYLRVVALVRRELDFRHPKLVQEVIDFDHPDASKIVGDDYFCALGTTLNKAGSKAAQYRVDCEYPYEIAKIALANGARQCLLVSSLGADAQSPNFYLRTKGELEQKLAGLGFGAFISCRPSMLFGERKEFRPLERIGIPLFKLFEPLMVGKWRKYRGIHAETVASAMIRLARQGLSGTHIVESDMLAIPRR